MDRLIKAMNKYLTDAKLRWTQEELLRKLQDAAEHHKKRWYKEKAEPSALLFCHFRLALASR